MTQARLFLLAALLTSCAPQAEQPPPAPGPLPIAHSNNAVAIASAAGQPTLYSFNGLRAGKSHTDVSKQAFACPLAASACEQIADVPVPEGRLASSAITLQNQIYLFGGYSVAEDGTEVSTPEVFAYDPTKRVYIKRADMPTPVDDAVLFTHQDRYIYLVSGWHNEGNVSLVQVYDTETDTWARATDYPGSPVFGHAGGAVDGEIIIADGVAVIGMKDGRRQFGEVDEVWHGTIAPDNHLAIEWTTRPAHPFGPLYRMAAIGSRERGQIIFAGGGDNPYNLNGVGYDGTPAIPSSTVFAFDLSTQDWIKLGDLDTPSMDHRGLLETGGQYFIIGGLDSDLYVRYDITVFIPER